MATINGTEGNDILQSTAENDFIFGFGGNDYIAVDQSSGQDYIEGGFGIDTFDVRIGSRCYINLRLGEYETFGGTGEPARGTLVGIESAWGTDGNDSLFGSSDDNLLLGEGGDDWLEGGWGADTLIGGQGIDTASYYFSPTGSVVADLLLGGSSGDARGDTYSGIENLVGSQTGDQLFGDDLPNEIDGAEGHDLIVGRGGADRLYGGDGQDILMGGAGGDYLDGGLDNFNGPEKWDDWVTYVDASARVVVDMLLPADNTGDAAGDVLVEIENLQGSQFNDDLRGDDLPNVIGGLNGDDTLFGRGGNDVLWGHGGNDHLVGGSGTDLAYYVDATQSVVVDLPGRIALGAEIGTDTLSSIEDVTTGSGNDAVAGNGATNVLDGGAGIDTVSYYAVSSGVVLDLAARIGNDGTSADTLLNFENANGTAFNDAISGTAAANVLNGLGGIDTISYYLATQGVTGDAQSRDRHRYLRRRYRYAAQLRERQWLRPCRYPYRERSSQRAQWPRWRRHAHRRRRLRPFRARGRAGQR